MNKLRGIQEVGAAFIDVVFDGPPSHESGRFVEVENEKGESVRCGQWIQENGTGLWRLRISALDIAAINKRMEDSA